ncbi:hypothetical protein BROUX41_002496 [Berkeleyomyces rouxiae]|uniref:uncharacterized protein n=1 Tax=Berkeleyomyces rouxiae TaxID=2035830 RepID=UPI003B8051CA
MKFLPAAPPKPPKSPREKTSFAKLFPLRSLSKKAAPQPPPMSIPRRPVPLPKNDAGPAPALQQPASPLSSSLADASPAVSVNPSVSDATPTPKPKPLSDVFAGDSLSNILSAYTRTSEDISSSSSSSHPPQPHTPASTASASAAKQPARPKDAVGAPEFSLSSDSLGYDYSVLSQYHSHGQDAELPRSPALNASSSLQVPGSAGLPRSPRPLDPSRPNTLSVAADHEAADRPVSVMSDLLSTYSSLPSDTPNTPMSQTLASPPANATSFSPSPVAAAAAPPLPAASSSAAHTAASPAPPSLDSPPNNAASDPQLWRRRSVKNDVPLQIPSLHLQSSAAAPSPAAQPNEPRGAGLVSRGSEPPQPSAQSPATSPSSATRSPQLTTRPAIPAGLSGRNIRPPPKQSPPAPASSTPPAAMGHSASRLQRKAAENAALNKAVPAGTFDFNLPAHSSPATTLSLPHDPQSFEASVLSSQSSSPTKPAPHRSGSSTTAPVYPPTVKSVPPALASPDKPSVSPAQPPEHAFYFPTQAWSPLPAGSVLPAPKLKPAHHDCLHRHQRMMRVSNKHHPLACQTCQRAETDDFSRCPWCALRVCAPCAAHLRAVHGHVSSLLFNLQNSLVPPPPAAAVPASPVPPKSAPPAAAPWPGLGGSPPGDLGFGAVP